MEKMSKKMMWSIAVAVLIIIAIVIVIVKKNRDNSNMTVQLNVDQQPLADATPSFGETGEGINLAYNEALKKYGTNRIQFNDTCQTNPNTVTYKAGTQVMFDNRSAGSHTITFNGTKHTIAGFGYTVITMTAAKYPTTMLVDCDKSQNVATVLIQK